MKPSFRILIGGLLAAAPLSVLVTGCGGGSGLSPFNPQPQPQPNQPVTQTSNLTLENGQRAILTTNRNGNDITGTLQILNVAQSPLLASKAPAGKVLNFNIAVGTYSISGTFTPPRGYSISGNFGEFGTFSLTGLLPTATEAGSYSLVANGQTDNGVIPVIGSPVPSPSTAPSPSPSTAPTSAPGGSSSFDLSFTPSSDSNFGVAPLITSNFTLATSINRVVGVAQSDVQIGKVGTYLLAPAVSTTLGISTNLADVGTTSYIYNYDASGNIRNFVPKSGTITLLELTPTSATIAFNNAVYVANEGGSGTGTVTLSGTIKGPLKTQ